MAVKLSDQRIREHRVSFAALRGPDAFRKAVDLLEQLSALNPLLSEAHRRELGEQFALAIPTTNPMRVPVAARQPQKPVSPAPLPTGNQMATCPTCQVSIRADRLEKHVQKVHGQATKRVTGTAPNAEVRSGPKKASRKLNLSAQKQSARALIVCGECQRYMSREDYAVHVCRMRARGPVILQGGSPGLRRR